MTSLLPHILLAAGGHGRVLLDALRACDVPVAYALDDDPKLHDKSIAGIAVRGPIRLLDDLDPAGVLLVNGIGSTDVPTRRRDLYVRLVERGFRFGTVVHPSAIIAPSASIGAGAQILAGTVVQVDARIDEDAIVNTHATIDHDTVVGAHSHVAPNATLSGDVTVGSTVHVGAGAVLIQGVRVADGALVGAGTVAVSDVPAGARVCGVPARPMARVQESQPC